MKANIRSSKFWYWILSHHIKKLISKILNLKNISSLNASNSILNPWGGQPKSTTKLSLTSGKPALSTPLTHILFPSLNQCFRSTRSHWPPNTQPFDFFRTHFAIKFVQFLRGFRQKFISTTQRGVLRHLTLYLALGPALLGYFGDISPGIEPVISSIHSLVWLR